MDIETKQNLLNFLLQFVTEKRKELFNEVLSKRTRHLTVVLEDIYQSQNASAVLRTCDLTGIQDIHIIENKHEYEVNPDVALGSSKWLNLVKYSDLENNTLSALKSLKDKGYSIVATTPHKNEQMLNDIQLNSKKALVFGTELTGLSDVVLDNADEYLCIPMHGFTESYNISVSAALILFNLTERLRKTEVQWQLTKEELLDIKLDWSIKTIKRSEVLVRQFLNKMN